MKGGTKSPLDKRLAMAPHYSRQLTPPSTGPSPQRLHGQWMCGSTTSTSRTCASVAVCVSVCLFAHPAFPLCQV